MKRYMIAALAALAVVFSTVQAYADSIGTVDYEKLVRSYQKAQSFQDDSKIREQELEKMRAEFVKQIRDAKNAQPNNPVATEQLEKNLEEKLQAKLNETRDWMAAKYKELDTEMTTAIQGVAAAKKLDVVLAKQTVFVGGTDITNEVLARLNAKK